MSNRNRIIIVAAILIFIIGAVFIVEAVRKQSAAQPEAETGVSLPPGSVPIYLDDQLIAGIIADDLKQLEEAHFVDKEEGKTQKGWMLSDIVSLYIDVASLKPDTTITVSSSSREKSKALSWAEVSEASNMVMFDLSNKGTLKLVSLLEGFDTRNSWIQDVDKVEISTP
jgi:hypothetical protein